MPMATRNRAAGIVQKFATVLRLMPVSWLPSPPAALDEAIGLARQVDPSRLSVSKRDPFLHQSAVAGIEVVPLARMDESVHPLFRQFGDELPLHHHGEDLAVYLEAHGGHHLPVRDLTILGEGISNRSEPGIDCGP